MTTFLERCHVSSALQNLLLDVWGRQRRKEGKTVEISNGVGAIFHSGYRITSCADILKLGRWRTMIGKRRILGIASYCCETDPIFHKGMTYSKVSVDSCAR